MASARGGEEEGLTPGAPRRRIPQARPRMRERGSVSHGASVGFLPHARGMMAARMNRSPVGVWRSLVAHTLGVRVVAGSNPATPTKP